MKNLYKIILVLLFFAVKANGQCSLTFYTTPSCDSNCTGTITVSVTGGTAPFSGEIDGGFPFSTSLNPFVINGICPGTHFLHLEDALGCTIDTLFTILQNTITIQPDSMDLTICGGNCASIYPTVFGGCAPYTYLWANGATTVSIITCVPGNYTLWITDACACTSSQTYTVTAGPCCPPDSVANPIVCERSTYTYTAPLHAGSTYQWTFTGDSIHVINNNSVTVTWGSVQTAFQQATISYIETFANGNQQSHSQVYWITTAPLINLTSAPADVNHVINICKGQSVSFINQTTNADNFSWDFGDGTHSNAQDVSHPYNNPGTYVIHFEASTDCGCAAADSFVVNVSNSTGPDIVCRSIVCEGDTATYSTSAICNDYYWNVTGGTIITPQPYSNNIQVVWNSSAGNGMVSLSVGNCLGNCVDTTFLNIPVLSNNSAITGRDTVCQYQTYTYSVPYIPGTYYSWSLTPATIGTISGNGTNEISIEFSYLTGACTLSVSYQNSFLGCSGTGTKQIFVAPVFGVNATHTVCKNDSASVNIILTGYPGQFNYTIVNPLGNISTQAYSGFFHFLCADTGYYSVAVSPAAAALFCELPDTIKVHCVTTQPVDSISGPQNICMGNTYTYTANGALPGHYIIWGVTGGTLLSSSGIDKTTCNVTWNGTTPHFLYCVQQDVNGNNCKSDTVFYSINEVTSASISGPSNVCTNGIYNYDVIVADMPGAYYEWTVTSSLASVKSGQGTKQIEVEYHNAGGTATVQCTLSHCPAIIAVQNNIVVSPAVPAVITPANPVFCSGDNISIQSAAANNYQWKDSVNALIGTAQSIVLTNGGNYSLITTDGNQCKSTLSFYVIENPSPEAILTSPSANIYCIPTPVNATLYAATNPGFSYQWLNNSLVIPGATSAIFNTTQTGLYQVQVTNNFGCSALSDFFLIMIDSCNGGGTCTTSEIISANVVSDNCNPISFSGFYTAGVTNPSWDFGDPASGVNNTSTLMNPSHLYTKPGYYYATYSGIVVNQTPPPPFCLLLDNVLATVLGSCDFDFEPACAGLPTQFNNLSLTLPGTSVTSYLWDFGDSNSSLQQNPQHVYQNAGTYTVTLTITYSTCTSTSSYPVTIPGATASLTANPSSTCKGTPVAFALSNNGIAPFIDWKWDFGDGISSLNLDPVRAYADSGTFTVTLIVIDSKGCTDTVSQNIFVNPAPVPGVINPSGPINECSYNTIVLNAPQGAFYMWNDGSSAQTFSPALTGNYFVEVTDTNHCVYVTAPVEVNISQPPVAEINGISEVCEGTYISLTASAGTSLSYEWHVLPSNQVVSTTSGYNLPASTPAGSYVVYLIETDNTNNCVDTSDILTVIIHANPPDPVITSSPAGYLCAGNNTTLEVINPLTNGIYLWSNGEVINYNNMNNPQVIVTQAGDYSVILNDSSGCKSYSNVITINPPIDFSNMIPGCYELCDTITHTLYGVACMNGTGEWIDISQQPPVVVSTNIYFTVTQTGIYQYVCNSPNCSDTSDAIDITIIHCCPVEPPVAQITYLNDTIFSSITNSAFTYTWMLNNQVITGANQPMLTPISDGCYTLILSDSNGCNTSSNTLCFVFTGVIETDQANEFIVFPNPASDFLKFKTSSNEQAQLKITDMEGRIVFENTFKNNLDVNILSFSEGMYLYAVSQKNKIFSKGKIIIAR
ncbi:MAG TPA: PKD domain-containing protein [Bacteroidia bacterium]|nr:PKD domain-containing protein [Bacteroidia bacterium]